MGGGGGCDSDIKGMGVLVVPFRVSYLLRCSASKGPTTGDFVGGGGACDSDIKGTGVLVVPFRVSYLLGCSA